MRDRERERGRDWVTEWKEKGNWEVRKREGGREGGIGRGREKEIESGLRTIECEDYKELVSFPEGPVVPWA